MGRKPSGRRRGLHFCSCRCKRERPGVLCRSLPGRSAHSCAGSDQTLPGRFSGRPQVLDVRSHLATFCWCCSCWRVFFFMIILEKMILFPQTGFFFFFKQECHFLFSKSFTDCARVPGGRQRWPSHTKEGRRRGLGPWWVEGDLQGCPGHSPGWPADRRTHSCWRPCLAPSSQAPGETRIFHCTLIHLSPVCWGDPEGRAASSATSMRAVLHTAELFHRRPPPPAWRWDRRVAQREGVCPGLARGPPPDRLARFLVSVEERPWTSEVQQQGLQPFGNVCRPLSAARAPARFLGAVISGARRPPRVQQMGALLRHLKSMFGF